MNYVDVLVTVASFVEVIFFWAFRTEMGVNPMLFRLLRIGKLARAIRMVAMNSVLQSLQILTRCLVSSSNMLFWTFLLLTFFQCVAGLVAATLCREFIEDETVDVRIREDVYRYYGTFTRTFLTMFEILFANWSPPCRVLVDNISEWFSLFFFIYRCILGFAVLNVVNAVFVQQTMKIATSDEQLAFKQKERELAKYTQKVKNLFATMDASGDGVINFDEFSKLVQSPMLQFLLSQLDLEYHDLLSLFEFLDNGDGEITLSEFIDGAAKLRGNAKALDIWRMETKIEVLFVEVLHALRGKVDVQEAFEEHGFKHVTFSTPGRRTVLGDSTLTVVPCLATAVVVASRSRLARRGRGAFKDEKKGFEVHELGSQTNESEPVVPIEENKAQEGEPQLARDVGNEFDEAFEDDLASEQTDFWRLKKHAEYPEILSCSNPIGPMQDESEEGVGQSLPRMTRKFKKARLRWTEDGRRVYIDENGEEINPFEGLSSGSSALSNGTPKVAPKEVQVELAPEGVDPELGWIVGMSAVSNCSCKQETTLFGEQKQDFTDLGITNSTLIEALDSLGFHHATKIQAASIPSVLSEDRRAVIISSETGSGKTLSYLVPAFELILRAPPRLEGDRHPNVLILVPSLELGVQVTLVAQQIAQAIFSLERRQIRVGNARRNWPNEVPEILVCSPRAAAQGLAPCQSEDEMARKQALKRIRDVEMVVFDEADLLLDYGSQSNDVQTTLTAIAASFPDQPRLVQPKAQVYRPDGIPVEVLQSGGAADWVESHVLCDPLSVV
eukprot:symbB.v1.2.007576.t1/scaffold386.1/size215569/2